VALDQLQGAAGHGLIARLGKYSGQELISKIEDRRKLVVTADATRFDAAEVDRGPR